MKLPDNSTVKGDEERLYAIKINTAQIKVRGEIRTAVVLSDYDFNFLVGLAEKAVKDGRK